MEKIGFIKHKPSAVLQVSLLPLLLIVSLNLLIYNYKCTTKQHPIQVRLLVVTDMPEHCRSHFQDQHDIFINYRVSSEGTRVPASKVVCKFNQMIMMYEVGKMRA